MYVMSKYEIYWHWKDEWLNKWTYDISRKNVIFQTETIHM